MRTVIFALLLGALAFPAAAQSWYTLNETEPETGSHIRKPIAKTTLYPLDRSWSKLTPQERVSLRRFYENMPENDEPPFPQDGLEAVVRDLMSRAGSVEYKGPFRIHVTVDSKGLVTGVDLVEYVDLKRARYLAQAFLDVKFKPAVCGGKPCTMQFPMYFQMDPR